VLERHAITGKGIRERERESEKSLGVFGFKVYEYNHPRRHKELLGFCDFMDR